MRKFKRIRIKILIIIKYNLVLVWFTWFFKVLQFLQGETLHIRDVNKGMLTEILNSAKDRSTSFTITVLSV